jgi:hypothetical protein
MLHAGVLRERPSLLRLGLLRSLRLSRGEEGDEPAGVLLARRPLLHDHAPRNALTPLDDGTR